MKLVNVHSHSPDGYKNTVIQSDEGRMLSSGMFYSTGIHPVKEIENSELELNQLEKALENTDCIAIGESGFDKTSPLSINQQLELFREQMQLSVKYQLPMIIHCVGKWNELEMVLKEKREDSPEWIIHGFRKMKLAKKFLDLGANLSFGKALLYDETIHDALAEIPMERIFLETDDEVFDIALLYEKLAALKSVSVEQVSEQIYENFRRVFRDV